MAKKKTKHRGFTVEPCEEHGGHPRAVTYTFDDESTPDVVYEDKATTVGYSKRYAAAWERAFGKAKDESTN